MLSSLCVVELAQVLAGPAVGSFFAELGATVIKIENPNTGGDMTRKWRVPGESTTPPISAYYASANYGKTVRQLDLGTAEGHAAVMELLANTDILLTNFRPKQTEKFGLAPKTLLKAFPQLIIGRINSYGDQSERPAFDVVLQAETGFLSMTGTTSGVAAKIPVAVIDLFAAHQLKEGILLALLQRAKTGVGAVVSVSLYDAAIASLANQASNWLMAHHIPQRMGTGHPNIAPYGDLFVSKDGLEMILAVGTDPQFTRLCHVLAAPELANQPEFTTNALRVQHRKDLVHALTALIHERNRAELLQELEQQSVPAAAVNNLKEVFESPEGNALILEEVKEGQQTKRVKTAVFRVDQLEDLA